MDDVRIDDQRPIVHFSREVLTFAGTFLTAVSIIATVGNSSFITVLLRSRKIRTDAHLMLLLAIAFSDLAISLCGYPFVIISCFAGEWVFGDVMCQLYAFLCYTFSMISANCLVVVSIFRYIVICKPEIKSRLTPRFSCICVLAAIIYALIWTLPPFFGWSRYVQEPFSTSCSFDWYDRSIGGVTYAFATCISCYLVHIIVMSYCYNKIRIRVSNLKLSTPAAVVITTNRITQDTNKNIGCCFESSIFFEPPAIHPRSLRTKKIEINVLKLNVVMVSTFFMIWTPYAVVSLLSIFYPDLPKFWYIFPTCFAKCSCMCNPIIYGLTNASLRSELRKLFRQVCFLQKGDEDNVIQRNREDGREIYDKEGIYLGKVNRGTCMCNGCTESRREVEVLMRLQMQRSKNMTTQESTFSFADEPNNPNQKTTPKEMIPTAMRIPR